LDDDVSIHQLWQSRFTSLRVEDAGVKIHYLRTCQDLRKFFRENFAELDKSLFLIDYEIYGSSENGLDMIEAIGIESQAILVTSRYEETQIRARAEILRVPMIPKPLAVYIPILLA
jgi:hypothetical protein